MPGSHRLGWPGGRDQPTGRLIAERITVALIPRAGEDLQHLQDRTGFSKTDIVNRAISLYEFIDAELIVGLPATAGISTVLQGPIGGRQDTCHHLRKQAHRPRRGFRDAPGDDPLPATPGISTVCQRPAARHHLRKQAHRPCRGLRARSQKARIGPQKPYSAVVF